MPIYEYECQACGHQLEILHKIGEKIEQNCPQCQADALQRLVSAPQFKLKGGGWYETDFKNKPQQSKSSSDTQADSKSSSSSESNQSSE